MSLTAAVAFKSRSPVEDVVLIDPEDPDAPFPDDLLPPLDYLAVVTQTLGSGDPWMYVDGLPSSGLTDEVDLVWPVVGLDGVDESAVGEPALSATTTVPVPGVDDDAVVGVPTLHVGVGRVLVVAGVSDGVVGLPVTMVRHLIRPAGVVGVVGQMSMTAVAMLPASGVDAGDLGAVRLSVLSPVVVAGVDESMTADPMAAIDAELVYRDWETDRKSTRLNSSHRSLSRMPSSA